MSIKSGFFDSHNGDRVYTANDLNNFVSGLLGDGVFKNYDDGLEVTANTGLTVSVAGGKAISKGRYVVNTGAYSITLAAAGTLPRYDAIVVGVSTSTREGTIYALTGEESATPVKPTPTQSGYVKELVLAYIYVGAGVSTIASSDIEDVRDDETVCGWVTLTNISATCASYRNVIEVVPEQMADRSLVTIGINQYNYQNDIIIVCLNGIKLAKGIDYTVELVNNTPCIRLTNALTTFNNSLTQKFEIEVLKLTI